MKRLFAALLLLGCCLTVLGLDPSANFSKSILAAGITSADLSLSIQTGHASRFPTAPFNIVVWNQTDYPDPSDAYWANECEVIRVTVKAGDTFTITRAQEGSTARNFNTGGKTYGVIYTMTAKYFTDIEAAYQPLDSDLTTWAGITPGANVGTFVATPSSANLRAAVTDETGTGVLVFAAGDIGAATATTPSANDNDTSVATTAYVQTELADFQPLDADLTRLGGIGAGASGDVIYRDATGWTNLVKSTDGKVLKLSSGLPSWQDDISAAGGESSGTVHSGGSLTTDNALVRADGTVGTNIQSSSIIIDDSWNMTGVASITVSGAITNSALTASRIVLSGADKTLTSSTLTEANILTESEASSAYQPLDTDLTRLGGIGAGTAGDLITRDATGWTNNSAVKIDTAHNIYGANSLTATTITNSGLTASRIVLSGADKTLASSSLTEANILTESEAAAAYQPLDTDLTRIAGIGTGSALDVIWRDSTGWTNSPLNAIVHSDTAWASSWNGVTTNAPTKNAVYDWGHTFDADDDGKVDVLDIASAGLVQVSAAGVPSQLSYTTYQATNTVLTRVAAQAGTTAGSVMQGNAAGWTESAANPYQATNSVLTRVQGQAGTTAGSVLYGSASGWTESAANPYQATNTVLTTWAGITPAANVGTALATPSSANLRAAVTDETGAGNLMFTRLGVTREVWIPAGAMTPSASSPAAAATNAWATATDGQTLDAWDFDSDADESVQWTLVLPDAWNASTVKAKVHWKPVNATSGTVDWNIAGGSVNDGEEGGDTLGTVVQWTDTATTSTNTWHISGASGAITVGGTPSAGHAVWFKLSRDANDVTNDTMANDARLLGVQIQYTETTTEPSAW